MKSQILLLLLLLMPDQPLGCCCSCCCCQERLDTEAAGLNHKSGGVEKKPQVFCYCCC